MDPVSLTLAIAPLCMTAIKGIKVAKAKLRVIRKSDSEIYRLRKKIKTQISNFLYEGQLLLQEVVDDATIESMLDDFAHPYWNSPQLEEALQGHLGRKCGDIKDTVTQISSAVKAMSEELDHLEREKSGDGKFREAINKACVTTRFVLSKSRLEELIESLTESIGEFRILRKIAKSSGRTTGLRRCQNKTIPQKYEKITKHSTSFHEVLVRTWSCVNPNNLHTKHTAKLLLDTDVNEEGDDLRLILGYELTLGSLRQSSLLLLRVRSEDLAWVDIGLGTPESSLLSEDNDNGPPAKVRRVRFAESSVHASVHTSIHASFQCMEGERAIDDPQSQERRYGPLNLCESKDLCQDVFGSSILFTSGQPSQELCIGYLDSACRLRHRILKAQDRQSKVIQSGPCSAVPLPSIFSQPRDTELTVPEQLRLALRLARSVLQFHSTPWWHQGWELSDLSYFNIDSELCNSLSTLHIDAQLHSKGDGMRMQDLLDQSPTLPSDDDMLLCGIRNITMHSLGTALLQIGRWEALDVHDIVNLRKKAALPSRLGPRYDDLTAKCLYCDFGYGSNLDQPRLQSAFYQNVVHELERMVDLYEPN
ncbi:hypothetical protein GQ53DRAFT_841550 [Thozetella sp. PMI_491]|nr:hypothetical protein GQ53DRAFT_841550 [Thozetella sp. PMI_491]